MKDFTTFIQIRAHHRASDTTRATSPRTSALMTQMAILRLLKGNICPPTEHYTMIGMPMYATTDMPEIPDIPYWDPSRDFSKGMIFQTKKDV
ncbi:hypothetical protein LINPERPRIM_LOCUS6162 [Linum perenne]